MTQSLPRAALEDFRTILTRRLGLQYEDGKLDYLGEIAHRRMEQLGNNHFGSYLDQLSRSPKGSDELRALAELLTINETFFFRNADNFRALTQAVLPQRMRERGRDKRLRILSAGCASGEEPYSLAIAVRETVPDLASWDVRIVGTDINAAVLAKAAAARYSSWSLRATSDEFRRRYFREDGRDFVLAPEVRSMVTFEERNLVDDDPLYWQSFGGDVVFCRNVLMYFAPEKMRDVVRRIGRALVPGGFLFLGHAETLRGFGEEFNLCHTHDTFYYRRREASDSAATDLGLGRAVGVTELAGSLPAIVESTASWVDAIRRASERIASLTDGQRQSPNLHEEQAVTPARDVPKPAVRDWDLALVMEAVRQERFADALELIGSLPPESHDDADALLLRAVLLTNNGRLDESEQTCGRLLALDELNAGAHYVMALCREHAGDTAGAIGHGQTAIYLDAGFAMPHLHLGIMAKRSGDTATAQRELGAALSLLAREDASRLLLFAGGFSRDALLQLCRTELRAAGGVE